MINQEQMNVVTYRRQTTITGEEVFQIFSDDFITGPLASGGTLYYGPTEDKTKMKAWEETESANGFFLVKNAVPGMWYYISGNSGELNIYYV